MFVQTKEDVVVGAPIDGVQVFPSIAVVHVNLVMRVCESRNESIGCVVIFLSLLVSRQDVFSSVCWPCFRSQMALSPKPCKPRTSRRINERRGPNLIGTFDVSLLSKKI
jgi:hypothetical protein